MPPRPEEHGGKDAGSRLCEDARRGCVPGICHPLPNQQMLVASASTVSTSQDDEWRTLVTNEKMSDYEQQAWDLLLERVGRREARKQLKPVRKMNELVDATASKLEELMDDHELIQRIMDGASKPFAGLQDALTRATEASISKDRLVARAAKRDPQIARIEDLWRADLRLADSLVSKRALKYEVVLGAEGAASSLAVTGAVVSSTVSGGTTLAVAAAAISTDVAANLAAATRVVAKTALAYGYDIESPDERVYMLGVLNYGSAMSAGSKAASLGQLSRLTQLMMRSPTHAQLDRFVAVRVARAFYKLLGFRLTHQRLLQAVPIVGAVFNAGLNAGAIALLHDRAQEAYRLRFLTEKYDLDPNEWTLKIDLASDDIEDDSIDVEQLIEDESRAERDDDADSTGQVA